MAVVTGLTASRMIAIENATVVSGAIDEFGHLILTRFDGSTVDAGIYPNASALVSGMVELATQAEVEALTDAGRVITPAALASTVGALNTSIGVTNSNVSALDTRLDVLEALPLELTPASFVQTTIFTSYPLGHSRLYYTSVNSTAWDFTGKAGEVLTFRSGSDFASQQWTKHQGGTAAGAETEVWVRTANTANGWSRWRKLCHDALLPDPQVEKNAAAATVSASAWADVTGVATITLTLVKDAIVQIGLSAWLSAPAGGATLRAGISVNGVDPELVFGGTWGDVLYELSQGTQPGNGQHSMTATARMAAGTHTFKVRSYQTVANGTLSYPTLRVTPLRWAE